MGLRLICKPDDQPAICVILCAESGGCMRLEAGGMASLELIEEVGRCSTCRWKPMCPGCWKAAMTPPIRSWRRRLHWLPS